MNGGSSKSLRIGRVDEAGPYLCGDIRSLDVDAAGRTWVLGGQAQEIRVFDAAGRYVRTVGWKGGGPGELSGALDVEFGPEERLWVMDPQNNRISVVDTAGAFVAEHRALGGFFIYPWPGGFAGASYYTAAPDESAEDFHVWLVGHDTAFTVLDTLIMPSDPVTRERFELRSGDGVMMAAVPFSGSFRTRMSPQGTVWGLITDEYRLFEMDGAGDTLRTIRRAHDALPVTSADRSRVLEEPSWFTGQGGKVDASRIPDVKPAAENFYVDAVGRLWRRGFPIGFRAVRPTTSSMRRDGSSAPWRCPCQSIGSSRSLGMHCYAVARYELEVPFIVRARIERP